MNLFRLSQITVLSGVLLGAAVVYGAADNLASNGDFEIKPPVQGGVPEWKIVGDHNMARIVEEDGNRFVRLSLAAPGFLQVAQEYSVGKDWSGVQISGKARIKDLKKGPEGHNTVTVLFTFQNADGKHVGGWSQKMFSSDQDWTAFEATVDDIPEGATKLLVACSIMNASATADFDDVVVVPILR